jgi:hypothetical protein
MSFLAVGLGPGPKCEAQAYPLGGYVALGKLLKLCKFVSLTVGWR